MAQLISVKLSRFDGSPWGFRLQGGKDFGTPLIVQKVNNGSPAEAAGLKAGDAVIKVNNAEMFNLRHKDAQDVIVRAGNNFEMTIQRGGGTWRPSISPVTPSIPSPQPHLPASSVSPVTKTSLAAKKTDAMHIGSGHNFTAKPFPNGTSDGSTIKSIVNKQYNSPVGIYSDQTIAETLSAQAEVLAGGVLGVNFKKNEKHYNAENSQVLKMVQEADKEPKTPEPTELTVHSGAATSPSPGFCGIKSVSAPETKAPSAPPSQSSLPPGQNICAECERLIVGVFVRIKEKNLHVECFKCSTCGTSLKNVGYYNINSKLYCDIHAKLVARQQAPNSGYVPITVPPSSKPPASTISNALGNFSSYKPSSPALNGSSTLPPLSAQPTSFSVPKPFGESHTTIPSSNFNSSPNSFGDSFPRPQSQTATVDEDFDTEEISRPPSSVKNKTLQWPPAKNIEDITYPTASPIWIDPNPILDNRSKHKIENRELEEICARKCALINKKEELKRQIFEQSYLFEAEEVDQKMDPPCTSCNTPFYRKTETIETQECRRSNVPRAESTESVRRSLTPTRINQPIPKPWRGSSTVDGVYGHVQAPKPPEPPVRSTRCTCKIICEKTSGPSGPEHEQEHHYREVICEVCNPPPPTPPPCYQTQQYQEVQQVQEVAQDIVEQETDNEVFDLSKVVPADIAVCPKGVENQHNMYTETMEKDEGNIHIKKTTVYEKTVEIVEPEQGVTPTPPDTRSTSAMDEEVEQFSCRKEHVDSAQVISSVIKKNQMIEERKEESRRQREAYEEECRREQERIRREEEEEAQRQANRLRILEEEKREKERRMMEQRKETEARIRQEEQERAQVVSEERCTKQDVRVKNEVNQECQQSLRQQVEVYKCMREQQAPEKRQPTLQERRLANRFRPQSPPQRDSSCQRKHVQFVTDSEEGVRPIPVQHVQNSTPKEWKSEMVNALTTAPERPYSPFGTSASTSGKQEMSSNVGSSKMIYSSQVKYEETCHTYPKPPEPTSIYPRPDSPFTSALTIASDRPYTPLGFEESKKYDSVVCVDRSDTPIDQTTEGYCHPAEILYTDSKTRQSRSRERKLTKVEGPRPLPPPPSNYKFRESSPSPARSLSRCETPRDQSAGRTTPLKRPDSIPYYQKYLVAMEQEPVEAHPYVPSRSPTPCRSKSPAPKTYEASLPQPACTYSSSTSISCQNPRQSTNYQVQEQPPQKARHEDYMSEQTYVEDSHSDKVYKHQMYSKKYAKISDQDYQKSEQKEDESCGIYQVSREPPVLPCPVAPPSSSQASHSAISERIQRTGVRVLPTPETTINSSMQMCESRKLCHEERSSDTCSETMYSDSTCPNTGFTVLPCRAISDSGTRAGVVIVPCESQGTGPQAGIRITPTPDRGFCVSPVAHNRSMSKCPPGQGGPRSGGCEIDVGNCPASGVKVATCRDGSVCVAPCKVPTGEPKPCPPMPYPHIPLPDQSNQNSCQPRTVEKSYTQETHCSFKPINSQPQTNLSSQLTCLTLKRDKKVSLFKSQPQSGQCSDGVHCDDGIHCEPKQTAAPKSSASNPYTPILTNKTQYSNPSNLSSHPNLGGGIGPAGDKSGKFAGSSAPKRGRGILNQAIAAEGRQPLCGHCHSYVRGPFITALGQIWCPEHFVCVNSQCRKSLHDIGFVEEKGQLYCEYCFERFIAPACSKCNNKIKGDCLNAIGKHFHPECFSCAYCGKLFGNSPFFLEDGLPYCEADWNELFTTKCFACGFPVEAGDRWVEALNNNYHSQCFNCTMCKKNLEGQSFYAKGGRPFCKNHAR